MECAVRGSLLTFLVFYDRHLFRQKQRREETGSVAPTPGGLVDCCNGGKFMSPCKQLARIHPVAELRLQNTRNLNF